MYGVCFYFPLLTQSKILFLITKNSKNRLSAALNTRLVQPVLVAFALRCPANQLVRSNAEKNKAIRPPPPFCNSVLVWVDRGWFI